MLKSDVELGATEQKFNMLVHRDIQREYGLPSPQAVLTMPILVGLDGERKMSKSLGNYVGITEPPGEMFGKLMSISDELMWSYYELLTDFSWPTIVRLSEEVHTGVLHPKKAKMELAHNIVAGFHGESAAKAASEEWDRVYSKRQHPSVMVEYDLKGNARLSRFMVEAGLAESRSDAERLIRQRAVEWDGQVIDDPAYSVDIDKRGEYILKVGKRPAVRVRVGLGC